jgi:hypothetical protein
VDVLADKGTAVVAVADGTVAWIHDGRRGRCCDVAIRHRDGWRSRYFHLNNDTPGSDDGRAVGIAPGIRPDAPVVAGQLVGWVGDSGNAEETVPHLHFELRRPNGTPIDPLPSLRAAQHTGRSLTPPRPGEADAGARGGGDGTDGEAPGGLLGWLAGPRRGDEDSSQGEADAGPSAPERDERLSEGRSGERTAGPGEPTRSEARFQPGAERRAGLVTDGTPALPGRERATASPGVAGDTALPLLGEPIPRSNAAPGAPPGLSSPHRVELLRLPPSPPRADAVQPSESRSADGGATETGTAAAGAGDEAGPEADRRRSSGLACFGFSRSPRG